MSDEQMLANIRRWLRDEPEMTDAELRRELRSLGYDEHDIERLVAQAHGQRELGL